MSTRTLPLLFINLGGEMIYILDQRLRAQNIPQEKARKVLHDITMVMFNKRFMDELFKPQELYSKKALRTVFDRLAHASIMRLNTASMDKLYDLMTMAFKYQVSLSQRPMDMLLVTLNHMDAIRHFVESSSSIRQQVDYVYQLLIQNYSNLAPGQFMLIRQTLLNFFQDMHIRVSIFLKEKVQNTNGRFVLPTSGPVPPGTEIPGSVRVFSDNGNVAKTTQFNPVGKYSKSAPEGSLEMKGNRHIRLGTNMYNVSRPVEATVSGTGKGCDHQDTSNPNPMAKAQLDLLSKLIGGEKKLAKTDFRLNLFNTDEEEEAAASMRPMSQTAGANVINIDASKAASDRVKKQSAELSRIMGELKVESSANGEEDDLLDLMDSAQ